MKRAIFYRGFTIKNYHKEKQGYLVVTPAGLEIWIKDAVSFSDCKWWVDDKIAKWTIEQAFKA